MADKVLRIKQIRSRIGQTGRQLEVLRTLGLRRIGDIVERPDNPSVRGAVLKVQHLVTIVDAAASAPVAKKAVKISKKSAAEAPAKKKKKKTTKEAAATGGGKAAKKKAGKKKAGKKKAGKKKTSKKKASGGKS